MEPAAKQRSRARSVFLTFALCFLPSAFCLAPLRGDIQLPPKTTSRGERQLQRRTPPPPTPVATKVRLQPGGSAEIVLQANGALGKTIEFLLRTPPTHGAFEGTLRRIGRDSVAVTYVHRAADGPGHDVFTFAAQAPGTAVSAAETVDIDIVDDSLNAPAPPGVPDLAASPSELDFGAVEMGSFTGATLTLENRGGGLANGRLDPPAPWVIDGDATYSLGRGTRQTFRFVFRPQGEGSFGETLRVDAGKGDGTAGCVVRLVGTGLPAPLREPLMLPPPAAPVAASTPAVASPSPSPALSAVLPTTSSVHAGSEVADPGSTVTNEAQVTGVKVTAVSASTVELAWKPPVPLPRSYRVERRSFARDDREADRVRIDWLPYERTGFRVRADQVTATLRGFAAGEPVTLRVVSVDASGQLSQPSPLVTTITAPDSGWWHLTPLRGLLLVLAGCVSLVVRYRVRERRLLRELDEQRVAEDPPLSMPR